MQKLHGCYANLYGDNLSGTSYLQLIGNNANKGNQVMMTIDELLETSEPVLISVKRALCSR